jgi:hypothetical protein
MSARIFVAEQFLAKLWALDDLLVSRGFHRTPEWWRTHISRFVHALAGGNARKAGKLVRRWVIRAGRRSGKSSTLARLAIAWWKWGEWSVPAGDIGVIAFVSVSKDEASARLRTIAAILSAMGEPYVERGDEIETTGARRALFKVYAASAKFGVGFTGLAIVGDEVSRWESRETAANPAAEVIGSMAPSLATQPYGWLVLSSAPWSTDDYHAERFDAGNTDDQIVSFGPTWVCNPTISEAQTHALEPDPRTWQREYAAEPGHTLSAALDDADVQACFRTAPRDIANGFVTIDASSLRNDAFTWLGGGSTSQGLLVVTAAGGWEDSELRRVSMHDVVAAISREAQARGTSAVFGDQREEAALRALFAEQSIALRSYAWSEPSKDTAMQLLRRLMRERLLVLPAHDRLRRELRTMKARLLPSGRTRYETNGLDYASALITLMHAIGEQHYVLRAPSFRSADDMLLIRSRAQRSKHHAAAYGLDHDPDEWLDD